MAVSTTKLKNFSEIISDIIRHNHKLSIINAPTGSGKSTLIVEEIYKRGMSCFLVVPTITGVKNLYYYMSKKIPEQDIGYAAEGEIHYNNNLLNKLRKFKSTSPITTKIVYATTGHLKNILYDCINYVLNPATMDTIDYRTINLYFCDFIILDEVHIGSIDIILIYRLWNSMKKIIFDQLNIRIPSLILTSATYEDPKVITYVIPDQSKYNVDVYYLDEIANGQNEIYAQIVSYLNNIEDPDPGKWLVFLPGIQEIELVKQYVNYERYDVFVLHSSLSNEETEEVFRPPRDQRRKLILSTNIAEISLTIDGLSAIIDSMLEKVPEVTSSGSMALKTSYISKDSAQQRKGRVGRTSNGKVYRMCTIEQFDELEQVRTPEIFRLPIINDSIKCLAVGLKLTDIFYDLPDIKISDTLDELRDYKAIDNKGIVTDIGIFVTKIPSSFKSALLMYHWNELYPIYSGVVLAILLEMSDTLAININDKIKSDVPLGFLMNIWLNMTIKYERIDPTIIQIKEYTAEYGIKLQSFLDLKKKILEILAIFSRMGEDVEIINFSPEDLYRSSHPILRNIYSSYIKNNKAESALYYKRNIKGKRIKDTPGIFVDTKLTSKQVPNEIIGLYTKQYNTIEKIALWVPYNL